MLIPNPSLADHIEGWFESTKRNFPLIAAVFLLTLSCSLVYVTQIPDVYRAETRILVNPQRLSGTAGSGVVSSDATERLNMVSEQILSTSRLETVFNDLNLYPELRGRIGHQELIDRMRRNIGIKLNESANGPSSFMLSYQGESPEVTAAVTNGLADSFLQWRPHDRAQPARGTTALLAHELNSTKVQLEDLEQQLRAYKLQHLGQLPNQLQANMQALSRLQMRLKLVDKKDEMATEFADKHPGESFTLLDVARIPDSPIGPNRMGLLLAALLISLAAGAVTGTLREVLDDTVKSEAQLREMLPDIHVLGLTPRFGPTSLNNVSMPPPSTWRDRISEAYRTSEGWWFGERPALNLPHDPLMLEVDSVDSGHAGANTRPGTDLEAGPINLESIPRMLRTVRHPTSRSVFESAPMGLAAEQFRVMQKRLVNAAPRGGTVLLTSPGAGDGKSLNAQNLSWALAEAGHSTVLLELDLRRPAQAKFLRPSPHKSIADVLAGRSSANSAVRRVNSDPLFYIGLSEPVTNPVELLRSEQLRELIAWARVNFTWVIMDGPPVLALADVEELLPRVDLVLMIARARATPRAMLARAAQSLGQRLHLLIFNDVPWSRSYGYAHGDE